MSLTRRHLLSLLLALPLAGFSVFGAQADTPEVAVEGGAALQGYDAVAYFTMGKAVKGDPRYALKWRGAMWYFHSPETMLAFEMNPAAYAPQYGGYCASAVAEGSVGIADPKVFAIIDGRLYLNNSAKVQAYWSRDAAENIARADANWQAMLGR